MKNIFLTLIKLFIGASVLFGWIFLFSVLIHCKRDQEFESAVKRDGLSCSRIQYNTYGYGKGEYSHFTYYRYGKLDTAAGIMKCNDYRKFNRNYSKKVWFGFYTNSFDELLPILTWEQYRRLQKYFPDSAAIMDTAFLY